MAKVVKKIKLQIMWWGATPAPPVWSMLGQAGVQINDFCTKFNEATKHLKWQKLPVKVYVYDDKSYKFVFTQPSATTLIKEELNLKSWSDRPHIKKVATIKASQLRKLNSRKHPDLNSIDEEWWVKILAWSCRSMGITVDWDN